MSDHSRSLSDPPSGRLFLLLSLSLALILPLLGFPVYFRTDDVHWLGWAQSHPNPLAAFDPAQNLFGYYRPLPTILWWGLYRLFGFEPLGYQVVLALLGVASFVPLHRIGARVTGRGAGGFAAVVLFHIAFYAMLYFYYWFSAITFALEILLLGLALDAWTDGERSPGRPVRFIVFAILAGLAKQPALLVIPAVAFGGLLTGDSGKRPGRGWLIGIGVAALLLISLTPFAGRQPGVLLKLPAPERYAYLLERIRFYGGVLLAPPAGSLLLGAALAAIPSRRGSRAAGFALGGAAGLLLTRVDHVAGLLILLVAFVAAAVRTAPSRPWLLGFLLPAAALPGVDFHVSTYLLEPAWALTPALLLWLWPLIEPAAIWSGRAIGRGALRVVAAAAPLLVLAFVVVARDRIPPLRTMRDVRGVFRSAVERLLADAPVNTTIGYLSYEEIGASYAEIRQTPIDRRVEKHKTMNGGQLEKFLRIRGRPDLRVVTVGNLPPSGGGERWLLAVSPLEREQLAGRTDLRIIADFHRGTAGATIFRVQ